ncbi:WRKY transcription factor 22-like [Impatiens glandulifera]|uniref:WRKY transcription factor 22-like n=1 Tax=Impatiens glandulifera TaxID=253017 RepID=UPI001FB0B87F|nr:WRKY transcription factor 22-like [Impatiens glandulifera]
MDDDWGLHAIVRSCNTSTTPVNPTTTTLSSGAGTAALAPYYQPSYTPSYTAATYVYPSSAGYVHSNSPVPQTYVQPSSSTFQNPDVQNQFHLQNDMNSGLLFPDPYQDLIFNPYIPKFETLLYPQGIPISPLSGLQELSPPQLLLPPQPTELIQEIHPSPKSKKGKKHLQKKNVCHVPADGLCSDMWCWRKYGQKPIKGSPYPRGYYRCSTLKHCMARKHVERNKSNPNTFILTYTGEHCHPMPMYRNSLAGCTRPKPYTYAISNKPHYSSESSSVSFSPAATPVDQRLVDHRLEDMLNDEFDHLDGSCMELSDDFFEGLEEITGAMAGEACPPFPWPINDVTTTDAGNR